ncbi:MAG: energy transducer TonB [Bacteroidales bacterium]|nr:energy transducer TonB [Bacteroidales bacterium]
MKKSKKDKDFLDLPGFAGGKEAFRTYISKNLSYPEEAIKKHIEGYVLVEFQINDMGKVISASVIKGLGYGCDEEALRLIKNAAFAKTRKQGVRVKSNFKTKIHFHLPRQTNKSGINYQYKKNEKADSKPGKTGSYSYSINKQKTRGKG